MRVEFTDARWTQDGEGFWLSLKVDNIYTARRFLADKKDKKYTADLKEHRERRSLDANAYAWLLIGKLSERLGVPPEQVYREAIKDVGGNYEVCPIRNDALEKWVEIWQNKGLGWVCDVIGKSKIDGYTNTRCFYGSSCYDSAQMSRLIDIIVQECKAQGIETMTSEELASLLEGGR